MNLYLIIAVVGFLGRWDE